MQANKKFGVLGQDPNKKLFQLYKPSVTKSQLPYSVSYEYLFSPVEDQKSSSLCVSYATTALAEAILTKRLHPNPAPDMSESALYSMTKHLKEADTINDEGLYVQDALWVLQNHGYVLSKDYPFSEDMGYNTSLIPNSLVHTDHELKGFQRVGGNEMDPHTLVEHMKLALFEHGPLVIGIQYQNDWMNPDANGFLTADPIQGAAGGHEMVCVGYTMTKNAFKLRQSWGKDFGLGGYVYFPFNSTITCDDAYTITL